MPTHTPTVRRPRLARAAAIACIAASAAAIVIADDQPGAQIHTIAEPSQPVTSRYLDIEANKAASMRALGLHIAEQDANRTPRFQDVEANKARTHRAR